MRKIFLVTGFNNWGKTRIIKDVFIKGSFRQDRLHNFPGAACDFMVMPYSNDDLHLRGYCEQYYKQIGKLKESNLTPRYIISAFCPTKEKEARTKGGPLNSDSTDIIRELYGEDEVHMLLLQYKWCDHAELRPQDISSFYESIPRVTVTTIASKTYLSRLPALSAAIIAHLP
jgi:hypothetical protein